MRTAIVGICCLLAIFVLYKRSNHVRLREDRRRLLETYAAQEVVEHVPDNVIWVEHLGWKPRVLMLHNFLTPHECDHLIAVGRPTLTKSDVVDNDSGQSVPSKVRTSSGTFLQRGQDEVISHIEARIAKYSAIPVSHGEGLQILRYQDGEKYEPHFDYFHDTLNVANGGQRIATMLMYLSDVAAGGETIFPSAEDGKLAASQSQLPRSECAKDAGVLAHPRKGDAILFYSLKPDGQLDPSSLHGGCPVVAGEKWSATKWMRVGPYEQ